ncbi:hypothetical protein LWI28_018395 [Acer negundo]|uniref:Reverse transcriptase domain-containing protein n=1 Tax=Acer negundo TaxID=4023 RepID=A0AAD5I6L4_ACENE|nr:hypothetical protein LWI28_018395 [Acer negundo]
MGFGDRWRQWMMSCISIPKLSVLINGSPTAQFGMERGLRQGDLLSPFLFNIVTEGLSSLFQKASNLGILRGANCGNGVLISNLQFADDTMLFLEPRVEYLRNARRILRCFELAAGLKLNFLKSRVVKVGMKWSKSNVWADALLCKEGSLPIPYLGLQLGARSNMKTFWNPIRNSIKKRLAPWKSKFLNKGGRLILIKAVLASIPAYYLSVYKIPAGVANDLEKLQSADGKFSVGSFRIQLEDSISDFSVDHKLVWQDCCPPKVEIFNWQVLRGHVMVRQVLHRFGVVQWWEVSSCLTDSIKTWFQGWHGLCPSISHRRVWDTLFAAVIWSIWESRNQLIFNGEDPSLTQAANIVKFRTALWFKHHGRGSKIPISTMLLNLIESCRESPPKKKIQKEEELIPPFSLGLKFNIDSSARCSPGDVGIGGILRNLLGKILGMFSEHIGVYDSNTAEMTAIHRAVTMCAETPGLIGKDIDIVSNSKVTVSWVNANGVGSLKHSKIIYDIRSCLISLGNSRVIFNSRASNSFADCLAKKGSAMEGDFLSREFQ